MRQKIFAVMGATGHIGHIVCEDLLKRGHIVRALGRDEKKLHQLELKGALAYHVDFNDADALTDAFTDAYAVFSFIPPSLSEKNYGAYQDRVSEAIVTAIQNAKVSRVVNLSSIGAQFAEGTGPIKGLYRHEQRLNTIKGLDLLVHLRPEFFMENLDGFVWWVENYGVIKGTLKPDSGIPMVATRDIGWKAADFLDSTAPLGNLVFEFLGPKNVTMNQVADIFGICFDHPEVKYEQISPQVARQGMIDAGMSPDIADLFIEMYDAFNTGKIVPQSDLKLSHRGTTTLEEYVQMLAHKTYAQAR